MLQSEGTSTVKNSQDSFLLSTVSQLCIQPMGWAIPAHCTCTCVQGFPPCFLVLGLASWGARTPYSTLSACLSVPLTISLWVVFDQTWQRGRNLKTVFPPGLMEISSKVRWDAGAGPPWCSAVQPAPCLGQPPLGCLEVAKAHTAFAQTDTGREVAKCLQAE